MTGRQLIGHAIAGGSLGFVLTRIGFADFQEVHAMFLLTDLRLLFTFAGGVVLTFVGFRFAARRVRTLPPKSIHRGVIPGSILFGTGWAITGACPGIVMVQLGAGQAVALLTLGGMVFGAWLAGRVFGVVRADAPRLRIDEALRRDHSAVS